MSYGLDLVQAQASQIIPYIAWVQNPELFNNDLMGMTFPYYGSFSLWYKAAGWLGTFFSPDLPLMFGSLFKLVNSSIYSLLYYPLGLRPNPVV